MTDRVIALIDMDCFYVQVEQRLQPELYGKPCAVVQYNGGGIIAVNYEARDLGVTRYSRGTDAKKVCPSLILVRVPEINRKADLTKYRNAGKEVIDVLSKFAKCVERASIDEAYIDLTEEVNLRLSSSDSSQVTGELLPTTWVVGWDNNNNEADPEIVRRTGLETWLNDVYSDANLDEEHAKSDRRLAVAATIVDEMRSAVLNETKFRCSAGIGHNKVLSKLACGLHKPNRQTIIPQRAVPFLFETLPLKKVRNLGGKLGTALEEQLNCETMGDIAKQPQQTLTNRFGEKLGPWLYDLCRGIDSEPVKARQLPQSIGCSKNFPGKSALATPDTVKLWLQRLSFEIEERLNTDRETNNRIAKTLSVHVSYSQANSVSRACGIPCYKADRIALCAYSLLEKLNTSSDKSVWEPAITSLGMSVSKFQEFSGNSTAILENFLKPNGAGAFNRSAEELQGNQSSDLIGVSSATDSSQFPSNYSNASSSSSKSTGFFKSLITMQQVEATKVAKVEDKLDGKQTIDKMFSKQAAKSSSNGNASSSHSAHVPLNADEIDSDVLSCLPDDIKDEIERHFLAKTDLEVSTVSTASKRSETVTAPKCVSSIDVLDEHIRPSTSGYTGSTSGILDFKELPSSAERPTDYDEIDDGNPMSPSDRIVCAKCNERVMLRDLFEHNDYHLALDLEREMRIDAKQAVNKSKANVSPNREQNDLVAKRKRRGRQKKAPAKVAEKKIRRISSYFVTQNGNDQ